LSDSQVTVTAAQFAQKLKEWYPQYASLADDYLVNSFVKQFPQYRAIYEGETVVSVSWDQPQSSAASAAVAATASSPAAETAAPSPEPEPEPVSEPAVESGPEPAPEPEVESGPESSSAVEPAPASVPEAGPVVEATSEFEYEAEIAYAPGVEYAAEAASTPEAVPPVESAPKVESAPEVEIVPEAASAPEEVAMPTLVELAGDWRQESTNPVVPMVPEAVEVAAPVASVPVVAPEPASLGSKYCLSCGETISKRYKFCPECGANQNPPVAEETKTPAAPAPVNDAPANIPPPPDKEPPVVSAASAPAPKLGFWRRHWLLTSLLVLVLLTGGAYALNRKSMEPRLWPAYCQVRNGVYRQAAGHGNARAQAELGHLYLTGNTVTRDYAQALDWSRRAALQGNLRGEKDLGVIYECGLGVARDPAQALLWYRKAAAQGDAEARSAVARVSAAQK
jgi:hypothetical protein